MILMDGNHSFHEGDNIFIRFYSISNKEKHLMIQEFLRCLEFEAYKNLVFL